MMLARGDAISFTIASAAAVNICGACACASLLRTFGAQLLPATAHHAASPLRSIGAFAAHTLSLLFGAAFTVGIVWKRHRIRLDNAGTGVPGGSSGVNIGYRSIEEINVNEISAKNMKYHLAA